MSPRGTREDPSWENETWIRLLKDVRTELLGFYVQGQRDVFRENYKRLIELTSNHDHRDFNEIKESFKLFKADILPDESPNLDLITLDDVKVGFLNDVLSSLLSETVFERKNEKKLVVKGWAVTASSINEYIKKNRKVLKVIEELEIFALEKVFLDENLNFSGHKIQLTIIAPTWEVGSGWEGRETINIRLNGEKGGAYEKDAGNLDVPGSDGNDGKQGQPGSPAGAILGIGRHCTSCESLKISAVGGQGGPGQDGGAGQKGKDGRDPTTPPNNPYRYKYERMMEYWANEGSIPSCGPLWKGNDGYNYKNCTIDGGGKPGGNGGNGGPGGIGGNGGKATLLLKENPELSSTVIYSARGKPGNPGKGGKGGSGATRKIYKLSLQNWHDFKSETYFYFDGEERIQEPYPPSKDGEAGLQLSNDSKTEPEPNYFVNPSLAINEYKFYLRQNMNKYEFMKPELKVFHDYLEQDDKINGMYDTLGLIKDLLGLENLPLQEMPSTLRKDSYQRLLRRVEKYELKPHELRKAEDFKIVLSYLYTALSSRIHEIDNDANKDLVVDIRKNLAYMEGNIDEWRHFKELVQKNKVRNNYKEGIQSKIEEANAFIENEITKDIEQNIQKTTDQLNKLYAETVKLQDAAEKEKKKLEEQKQQLERQLILRSIFGVVQIASAALAFIGPVGAAVGAVIGGVTSAVEGLTTSSSGDVVVSALPGAVSTTLTKLNDAYKEKQENFKKQLLDANTKMEAFLNDKDVKADQSEAKKKVLNIHEEMTDTKRKLEKLMKRSSIEDPASVSKMYDLRKKMDSLLKEGKTEIGKLGGADKYKNVVDKVQNIVGLAKMGVDLYNKVQGDLDKIDGVDKSIAAVNAKMGKLDAYEESIYTKIGPMVRRIKKSLEAAEDSEGKSHAALDVTKWQVQGSIRDIRKEMQEMTKGFTAGNEITYCIDKVEYAMSMMIQMFDRIQSYSEQGDLVDVITDVDSAADILNTELYSAVSELKLKISSNIISEYTNTMNAVKQYVFPFAEEYIKPLTLPDRFNLNKTDQLVYNLKTLQKTLQREESTTLTRESNIMSDVLFVEGENHPPFFKWHDYYTPSYIRTLFEGGEVTLNADIHRSVLQENAVKFNDIGIRFKANNPQTQERLDRALAEYVVRMNHTGDSYYRCGSSVYEVSHQPQIIRHAVVKNANGGYSDGNVVYTKITNNEPVLSPFGTWTVALESKNGNDFNRLREFTNTGIELILEGKGNFVKRYSTLCSPELSKYYNLIRPIGQRRQMNDLAGYEELLEKLENYRRSKVSKSDEYSLGKSDDVEYEQRNETSEWIQGGSVSTSIADFPRNQSGLDGFHQNAELPGMESTMNHVRRSVNSPSLASNLPLFELMIRKINGTNRARGSTSFGRKEADSDFAQSLAYSAYAPK